MLSVKYRLSILLLISCVGFQPAAFAELYSRANGSMVYDSDRDITWLADANYAATLYKESCGESGVVNGKMGNPSAKAFVQSLVIGGYSDWRLPKTIEYDETCSIQAPSGSSAFNCVGGELGHLFYNALGGEAGHRITVTHNENFSKFKDVQAATYWTGTDFAPVPQIAMNFQTSDGVQNANSKSVKLLVWPVRDGDVAVLDSDDLEVKHDEDEDDEEKHKPGKIRCDQMSALK